MIYYRDKVLNNLFEDKGNSDIIQKALNYFSQNPSIDEDETLADIVQKVYKDHEFNLLDNNIEIEQDKSSNDDTKENNSGIPSKSDIEKASVAVQDVENK